MNISGQTSIIVNGKLTRVCGRHFNEALKKGDMVVLEAATGERLTPSKGLTWEGVADAIRNGKQVQASAGAPRKKVKGKAADAPTESV